MALFSTRSWDDWIAEYGKSHTHPANRVCHTIGIPLIAVSIISFGMALFVPLLWKIALALFVVGWVLQFIGHAYERKPPEFFKDWRFLFVGLRWWFKKVAGKA
jgi:uncharacterized membrane protein YGL010W